MAPGAGVTSLRESALLEPRDRERQGPSRHSGPDSGDDGVESGRDGQAGLTKAGETSRCHVLQG